MTFQFSRRNHREFILDRKQAAVLYSVFCICGRRQYPLKVIESVIFDCASVEPGTFKDRLLLERDPHQLIEGVMVAGFAIEADIAYIFLRGEYTLAAERQCVRAHAT